MGRILVHQVAALPKGAALEINVVTVTSGPVAVTEYCSYTDLPLLEESESSTADPVVVYYRAESSESLTECRLLDRFPRALLVPVRGMASESENDPAQPLVRVVGTHMN